jgi:hypothetical protein
MRIQDPSKFKKGSFRTHDIGRKGYSKRIAGKLKKRGTWATQAILISRKEKPAMKKKLRESAKKMIYRNEYYKFYKDVPKGRGFF